MEIFSGRGALSLKRKINTKDEKVQNVILRKTLVKQLSSIELVSSFFKTHLGWKLDMNQSVCEPLTDTDVNLENGSCIKDENVMPLNWVFNP